MTNEELLDVIKESFAAYLNIGTSTSTKKLKSLHGHIASDLKDKLGENFSIKSQGYGDDSEGSIEGRYYSKNVDITIKYLDKIVAGLELKFVMRNYSQNSNNYFENMLGETANIRSNAVPYFQILILFDKVPYYKDGGVFSKYDIITQHNLDKYLKLSEDDPSVYFHTPDKTLVVLLSLKEKAYDYHFKDKNDYADYYSSVINDSDLISYSTKINDNFGNAVILNDYENFIRRMVDLINGRLK